MKFQSRVLEVYADLGDIPELRVAHPQKHASPNGTPQKNSSSSRMMNSNHCLNSLALNALRAMARDNREYSSALGCLSMIVSFMI